MLYVDTVCSRKVAYFSAEQLADAALYSIGLHRSPRMDSVFCVSWYMQLMRQTDSGTPPATAFEIACVPVVHINADVLGL